MAESPYAYLALSSALVVIWLVLHGLRTDIRQEMRWVSLGTMLLGLTVRRKSSTGRRSTGCWQPLMRSERTP